MWVLMCPKSWSWFVFWHGIWPILLMLFAVSGARSDVEWKDVSLVPAAVNGGKQADTGTCVSGKSMVSASLGFDKQLARLWKWTSEFKYHNTVHSPCTAVIYEWSFLVSEEMVARERICLCLQNLLMRKSFVLTTVRLWGTVHFRYYNNPVIQGEVICLHWNPSFIPYLILQLYWRQALLVCSVTYFGEQFLPNNIQIKDFFLKLWIFYTSVSMLFIIYNLMLDTYPVQKW